MKFVEAPYDTEVIDQSDVDAAAQRRANKRLANIVATPEEYNLYAYAPNRARNIVDRPGMPCEDYMEDAGGAKD